MALIPMKDTVIITLPGDTDAWGNVTPGESKTYKCRIDERTKVVKDQHGREVVSNTQIMIDKQAEINYDYTVSYVDLTGKNVEKTPISIEVIKDISSKPLFTVVNV